MCSNHLHTTPHNTQSTIVIATGNAHKAAEIEAILGPRLPQATFVTLASLGSYDEPVEDGETFVDNALIKARAALDATGLLAAIADDSGLVVDALNGAPGVLSARWAGEHGNDAANNDKLLAEMQNIPDDQRSARFHSAVVFVTRDEEKEQVLIGEGDCEGSIGYAPRGTGGFGYDPLFELADINGKTMAELSAEEKNAISHRYRALVALASQL